MLDCHPKSGLRRSAAPQDMAIDHDLELRIPKHAMQARILTIARRMFDPLEITPFEATATDEAVLNPGWHRSAWAIVFTLWTGRRGLTPTRPEEAAKETFEQPPAALLMASRRLRLSSRRRAALASASDRLCGPMSRFSVLTAGRPVRWA